MITRGAPAWCPVRMRRVASRPSISGIRMSMSTTSGRVRRTASTACAPLLGLGDDVYSVRAENHGEPGSYQGLIVGHDDPQRLRRGHGHRATGMVALTR